MALGEVVPAFIKLVIASALGRPRFSSDRAEARSGEPHELAGLPKSPFRASSAQFHGYNIESGIDGFSDTFPAMINQKKVSMAPPNQRNLDTKFATRTLHQAGTLYMLFTANKIFTKSRAEKRFELIGCLSRRGGANITQPQ